MLLLLFNTHNERYAINCSQIIEVIPSLILQPLPMTPDYVSGAVNYRGIAHPVIDLSQLLDGTQSSNFLSTRIILINFFLDPTGSSEIIGLLAEKVTETVKTPKGWSANAKKGSPCFIESSIVGQEMVQWFEPINMLPKECENLFMDYTQIKETS